MALIQANADMVQKYPNYVVRITGSDEIGKGQLKYFISTAEKMPVIATTSKLLSTGVDCKMTKLIVLDQMIGSMTEFKQIIGRGTRLRWEQGKKYFTVMDIRNVARLFADPDWDGPIEIDPDYDPDRVTPPPPQPPFPPPPPPPPGEQKPVVTPDGCRVQVIMETVSVYDANGKLLKQESITDYTKANVRGEYASLDAFIQGWTQVKKREAIQTLLEERGINLETLKEAQGMTDVDDFDFLCHVAFDKKPLTRRERANNVRKRDFFSKYGVEAQAVLEALLEKYMNEGISEIETLSVLRLSPFVEMGSIKKITSYFGSKDAYIQAVRELEEAIYLEAV